jgi:hypothetical protein
MTLTKDGMSVSRFKPGGCRVFFGLQNPTSQVGVFASPSSYDGAIFAVSGTPRMKRSLALLTLFALLLSLQACSNRSKSVIGGPDAEEAGIRMEESRQAYNDCVAQIHPGAPSCDRLKALYQKDKAEYEAQVR